MHGKLLKVSNNDLYGNTDDREVAVYAVFNHVKYMNKYIIFSFPAEYDKKKLYFGSVHLKQESLVTFSIPEHANEIVMGFVDKYLSGAVDANEYEIIDISNFKKIELVSYNEIDSDKLLSLDRLSIPARNVVQEEAVNKKPAILYFLLIFLILSLVGVTLVYFFPEKFTKEYKLLECTSEGFNEKIEMNYARSMTVRFYKEDKLRDINVIDTYTFDDVDKYYEFKENNYESIYLKNNGAYKYEDDKLELKLMYEEETIIEDYGDMRNYLTKEGYSCEEGKYNE